MENAMEISNEIKLQPFKMHANLYFIGCEKVSVHLLNTSAGLVMIDTGYPDMRDLILSNIEKIGFHIKDLVAIFHSHGHIDHFGNTIEFSALSGAKTYISRIDNEIVNGKLDLSWAKELGLERIPPFSCDVLLEDGDEFDFGNTKVRCIHTPGHTEGVMSFFITLSDGTVAAMHGGIGTNSLHSDFLTRYGLSFDCRKKFRSSLARLACEKADLVLGNHPETTDTKGKMVQVLNGKNDIRDRSEWSCFLLFVESIIDDLEKNDPTPQ